MEWFQSSDSAYLRTDVHVNVIYREGCITQLFKCGCEIKAVNNLLHSRYRSANIRSSLCKSYIA